MKKHPDCEDRCQLLEHKGYRTCSLTGHCEQILSKEDADDYEPDWTNDDKYNSPTHGQAEWINGR